MDKVTLSIIHNLPNATKRMLEQYSLSPLNKWPTGLLIYAVKDLLRLPRHYRSIIKAIEAIDKELEIRVPEDINDNN